MFSLCHACGAPQPGPCYPECPITSALVEADRRESEETRAFLEKARDDARRRRGEAADVDALKRTIERRGAGP